MRENSTSAGAFSAKPMLTAMAGPATDEAKPPIWVSSSSPSWVPAVFRMVPMSSEAKRPWAMAPMASTP